MCGSEVLGPLADTCSGCRESLHRTNTAGDGHADQLVLNPGSHSAISIDGVLRAGKVSYASPVSAWLGAWHVGLGARQRSAPFLALPLLSFYSLQSSPPPTPTPSGLAFSLALAMLTLALSHLNHYGTTISAGKRAGRSTSEFHWSK